MPYAAVLVHQNGQPVQVITDPAWLTPGDVGQAFDIPSHGQLAAVTPGGRGYRFDEGSYKGLTLFIATHNEHELGDGQLAIGFSTRGEVDEHAAFYGHDAEPPTAHQDDFDTHYVIGPDRRAHVKF